MAQQTRLMPYGVSGRLYGSFSGKTEATIAVPTVSLESAILVIFRDRRLAWRRDKRMYTEFRDKRMEG